MKEDDLDIEQEIELCLIGSNIRYEYDDQYGEDYTDYDKLEYQQSDEYQHRLRAKDVL